MSSPRLSVAFGVSAVFLAITGCQTPPEKLPPPKSTVTLVLKSEQRTVLSTLTVGSALRIVLPPPSQGPAYAWEILSNNIRVLRQTSPVKADLDASGHAIAYSVVFQAIKPSPPRSIVTIAAVQPGVTESEPSDIFQVTVGVKAQPER